MQLDWKKIGLIILFIVAVLFFAFFLYFFFFRTIFTPATQPTNQNTNQANINGGLISSTNGNTNRTVIGGLINQVNNPSSAIGQSPVSPIAQGGVTQVQAVINQPAYFPVLDQNNNLLYYDKKDGKFYRTTADGQKTAVSETVFHEVANTVWSHDRNLAVLQYPDGSNIVYDFKNNKQITLPSHWTNFSFSTDDQQLVFKSYGLDMENRFLAVAKNDGTGAKILESIGGVEDQFQAAWSPNNQMVATFKENKDMNRSNIYFIGLNKENFKSMTVEGRDFQGVWSPQGNAILYSVYNSDNDYKPQLWISEAYGDNIGNSRQKIELSTWADKCYFADNSNIYCAVPKDLPYGAGMDRTIGKTVADDIYQINLTTGAKSVLAVPDGDHSISSVMTSADKSYLFFTDANSNKIYKIKLK
ncbi:MAG: hypothetical protein WC516_00360 [Patescibacteria group bacterium]